MTWTSSGQRLSVAWATMAGIGLQHPLPPAGPSRCVLQGHTHHIYLSRSQLAIVVDAGLDSDICKRGLVAKVLEPRPCLQRGGKAGTTWQDLGLRISRAQAKGLNLQAAKAADVSAGHRVPILTDMAESAAAH